jgi:hypothetical protein
MNGGICSTANMYINTAYQSIGTIRHKQMW